jgi:5-methylcytosine-specific restriction endonuclease McrA
MPRRQPNPAGPAWRGHKEKRAQIKTQLLATYGNRCWLCGKPIPPHQFTIDHVIPRSQAPELTWVLDNLRPAHSKCNKIRGTRTPAQARALIQRQQQPRAIPKPSRDW